MAIKVAGTTVVDDSRNLCNVTNYNKSSTNFFAGNYAGQARTTGSYNTAIGPGSAACLTTGSNNFFSGRAAGNRTTTGSYNTFIGS
jgi:hypothetical protein